NLVAFEPYRPYAIGVALVCMVFAYRTIYAAPAPEACEPGTVCAVPQTRRIYKALFWVVSAMALVPLVFPYTARFFYEESTMNRESGLLAIGGALGLIVRRAADGEQQAVHVSV